MPRTLTADLRYAVRSAFRTPSFAAAVVAVLALGIGANTAIFGIVNAVLLRPLPYDEPERLVRLFHVPPQNAFPGMKRFAVSAANFYDWKQQAQRFDGMAIYAYRQFTLTGAGAPESVLAGAVGADFFDVARSRAALGRVFLPEEDAPARKRVVVLSDAFWKSHFGGSPQAVGSTLRLNGEPYTVVGVMPARFSIASWGIAARSLWVPLAYDDQERAVRDNHNEAAVGRLKPNVTVAQAQAEMDVISSRLERDYPQANTGWGATVVPLQELLVGDIRLTLVVLLAAVALVLLIACANVANLLFTRALGRRKEIAIRSALGAGRGRVFQQLIVEALFLSAAGGVVGLLLARFALSTGATLLANQIPRADEIALDGRVLLFAVGASALTGMLAGGLPALRAGRGDLNESLKEGGRSDAAMGLRTRRALIICEVALSVVLLMSAGVMIRSLLALRSVDAGFDSSHVLTFRVSLPDTRYGDEPRKTAFFAAALQGIRALPGVQAAGTIDSLPTQGGSTQPIVLEGHAELLPRDQPTVSVRQISPGYLRAMRIPVVAGRDFADNDQDAMLVSRSAAKLLWGDDDPIGRRATLPLESKTRLSRVIGIVGDVKQDELSGTTKPTVYQFSSDRARSNAAFAIRTAVPPASLGQTAAGVVRQIDAEQPVEEIKSMDEVLDDTLTGQRFGALLLGLFAAVALLLATVGIYSVLSYIVRGRSREIGIRTALGARPGDVLRLVVREAMTPALIGVAAGVVAALASSRLMSTMVFGISPSDPLTLTAVAGTLTLVALLASVVPAYRAARLDPSDVLR